MAYSTRSQRKAVEEVNVINIIDSDSDGNEEIQVLLMRQFESLKKSSDSEVPGVEISLVTEDNEVNQLEEEHQNTTDNSIQEQNEDISGATVNTDDEETQLIIHPDDIMTQRIEVTPHSSDAVYENIARAIEEMEQGPMEIDVNGDNNPVHFHGNGTTSQDQEDGDDPMENQNTTIENQENGNPISFQGDDEYEIPEELAVKMESCDDLLQVVYRKLNECKENEEDGDNIEMFDEKRLYFIRKMEKKFAEAHSKFSKLESETLRIYANEDATNSNDQSEIRVDMFRIKLPKIRHGKVSDYPEQRARVIPLLNKYLKHQYKEMDSDPPSYSDIVEIMKHTFSENSTDEKQESDKQDMIDKLTRELIDDIYKLRGRKISKAFTEYWAKGAPPDPAGSNPELENALLQNKEKGEKLEDVIKRYEELEKQNNEASNAETVLPSSFQKMQTTDEDDSNSEADSVFSSSISSNSDDPFATDPCMQILLDSFR